MRLKILRAGPHVSFQDAGRPGFLRFGVPQSGPMDRLAYRIAQEAVAGAGPAIEVSPGGLAFEVLEGEGAMAMAGGGFTLDHQGERQSWAVVRLRAGERVELRPGFWGNWAYLAFAGRLEAPLWLGSAATHGPSGFGGGALWAGQEIVVAEARTLPPRALTCPLAARPRREIRAVAGPQDRYFPASTLALFFETAFRLSPAFDRMGLRLDGPELRPEGALSIPSEAVLRGSVQVNGAGVASILMADHQTTGGYPKIATVIDADLDALSRLRPGETLRFRRVTSEQAVEISRRLARSD
jgi:allophanate hydrolase